MATAADVDALIEALRGSDVDDAYLTSDTANAPVMHVAVRDEWAYLSWTDDEFLGSPVGDPRSSGTHGTFNTDYFPGTGLSLAMLAVMLKEFLTTGQRPTAVRWISDDELEETARVAATR